jgi:hypothetical protein
MIRRYVLYLEDNCRNLATLVNPPMRLPRPIGIK